MPRNPGPFTAYLVTDYPTDEDRQNGTKGMIRYVMTKSELRGASITIDEIKIELEPGRFKETLGGKAFITGIPNLSLGQALEQGIARIIA